MDTFVVDRRLSERGVTSVQFLLAGALSLILFLVFANLIVVHTGVVRFGPRSTRGRGLVRSRVS